MFKRSVLLGSIRAFGRLIRIDRPIGTLLLLWPTLTALWISSSGIPDVKLIVIFSAGTLVMRSAGCCINDYADANFDGHVNRTKNRPIIIGEITPKQALFSFGALCSLAFILVLFLNLKTIILSIGAFCLAAIYPFMKRVTDMPQVVLGIAFSFGILMAFSSVQPEIPTAGYFLFFGNIFWTIAYDTQYAMADREDDLVIGIGSTAVLFGKHDRKFVWIFQIFFLALTLLAGLYFNLNSYFYLSLVFAASLFYYQAWITAERKPTNCLAAFKNNNWVGASLFCGTFLSYL
ncbi:4-hydroxybenzoate octaprenyltransferase [Gammaproteobacteria bacterium]|nr:4-hydroxybenzoate octaprenyltransferase [Gammaproteobacteria bacterium]